VICRTGDDGFDKPHEECGVFGIYDPSVNVTPEVYYGLFALQHRGQESAGMTLVDGDGMKSYRAMGLVTEVFRTLPDCPGAHIGIGHVRYSTTGSSIPCNIQPLQADCAEGPLALAHNGNLVNMGRIRAALLEEGADFQTTMDSEVIVKLIARSHAGTAEEKICDTMSRIRGAYALVICTGHSVIGVRDPFGYRPLVIGRTSRGGWVLASETCALDAVGAQRVRDVQPGEIVTVDAEGIHSIFCREAGGHRRAMCVFEYIYFARPDSIMNGQSIYQARLNMGRELWKETGYEADAVMSVPDSGNVAALGYSHASGIPYIEGLMKNKYMGRTFIQPDQNMRERAVRMKLNPVSENVMGKRIVLIDDSIVRGTTSGIIIRLLKEAGAAEINLCISSPPVCYPCFFGIDTAERKQLIAAKYSCSEICRMIGADRLHYLSKDGLARSIQAISRRDLCFACFDGKYPEAVPAFSEE
jgi:amidophosphoribosyltransferase